MVMPHHSLATSVKIRQVQFRICFWFLQLLQGCTTIFCWLIWFKKNSKILNPSKSTKTSLKTQKKKLEVHLKSHQFSTLFPPFFPCFPPVFHHFPSWITDSASFSTSCAAAVASSDATKGFPASPATATEGSMGSSKTCSIPKVSCVEKMGERKRNFGFCWIIFWSKLRKSKGIYRDIEGRGELRWGIKLRNTYNIYLHHVTV